MMVARTKAIHSIKTALIVKAILELSTRGFGEYVTIRLKTVLDELNVRDVDRRKYGRNFVLAVRMLEPCLVERRGHKGNMKYIFKRECLWRYIQLSMDASD